MNLDFTTTAGPAPPAKPGPFFSDNDSGSARMSSQSSDNHPLCGAEPSAALRRAPRAWLLGAGVALCICGTIVAWLFKSAVVDPAYTPLPGGHPGSITYVELYGPVSLIRLPVYVLCGGCIAAGLVCVGLGAAARGGMSE